MHDPLPAPRFDRSKYERPNDAWVCGRLCEGQPCHLGPSPGGACRTRAECRPLLEVSPGESKGRWKCTRSKEAGGPCENGPDPVGGCGRPVVPCVPERSLRQQRGRVTAAVIALTVGGLLLLCTGPWRYRFISPGPVSVPHRSPGFSELTRRHFGPGGAAAPAADCAGCHPAAGGGLTRWVQAAANTRPGAFEWARMARTTPDQPTRMDERNCLTCHQQYDRHQPHVVQAHSCADCHREHRGDRMAAPSDDSCASCHNNEARLSEFAAAGVGGGDPLTFHPPGRAGLIAFVTPRSTPGRPPAFAHYWDGHPDFGLHRPGVVDSNTLRFNHEMHLGDTVKLRDAARGDSRNLACTDCHQADSTGAYFARIRFQQHCQTCHSLQFDPVNPEVKLPHGPPPLVRATVASLATLQTRYAELARSRGETDRARIDDFARTSSARVRQLLGTGEELVDLILFTGDPRRRMFAADHDQAGKRAHYAGCAYCHEVGRDSAGQAVVTPPKIPDRWLPGGRFHHAKHAQVDCLDCHGSVRRSSRTADINLPHQSGDAGLAGGIKTCTSCHKPRGAPANCATCHSFHLLKPL